MARKPTGKPNGRPLKAIDQETFEGLCEILCTQDEILSIMAKHFPDKKLDADTLNTWCHRVYSDSFSDIYKKLSSGGKMSLRRTQYNSALSGNVPMMIWLGKQYLDQKDKTESDTNLRGNLNTEAQVTIIEIPDNKRKD